MQEPTPPLGRDVLEAIGSPATHRAWPSEAETGWQMRVKARKLIDSGEIKTLDGAIQRFRARAGWINSLDYIGDEAKQVWVRMEEQFLRSARKYLFELQEGKSKAK